MVCRRWLESGRGGCAFSELSPPTSPPCQATDSFHSAHTWRATGSSSPVSFLRKAPTTCRSFRLIISPSHRFSSRFSNNLSHSFRTGFCLPNDRIANAKNIQGVHDKFFISQLIRDTRNYLYQKENRISIISKILYISLRFIYS